MYREEEDLEQVILDPRPYAVRRAAESLKRCFF